MAEPVGTGMAAAPDSGLRLYVGFRGFAAAFEPALRPFLEGPGKALTGLSEAVDEGDLLLDVTAARPDYVLVSDTGEARALLREIAAAARTATLGVLTVGQTSPGNLPPGLIADRIAPGEDPLETALTLRALMRRCRPQSMLGRAEHGDLVLDEACLTFAIKGESVALSLEAFGILGAMMDDPGRTWDRARLHALVFGRDSDNDIRAIDTRISRARRQVIAALGRDPIRTERGVGYALVAEP
ncbi:winged helix-turn-helix domain-containing protein [Roseibacterium sp. SDUM158016]|uniref:winged helix-turn-helix domain-containing protein n=1 Tax=Roseicyclus sediminis TaxID=2980997 RepID=UPI0021D3D795|nr:winged helix-turn-helix domain-containing protein [Roseibacterium sp. SDUM158016]MCU4655052.1 winged helix-turn-helix domain-containing protein [Roseibacterium sp. SDUM158016]